MTKKRVSRRLIFIAIWNNKVSTSLLGEIMVPLCFALRPRVFHWDSCFPPDPVFSTTPRVFHTPGPRIPGPQPRVFHLANHAGKFPHKYTRVAKKNHFKADISCISVANNPSMDVTQLALTLGWPNGEKLALTRVQIWSRPKWAQVIPSQRKCTQAVAKRSQGLT